MAGAYLLAELCPHRGQACQREGVYPKVMPSRRLILHIRIVIYRSVLLLPPLLASKKSSSGLHSLPNVPHPEPCVCRPIR